MTFPPEFRDVIDRARTLSYAEAFALSRRYERSPDSAAGQGRAAFDRIVKEHGLRDCKDEWMGALGVALTEATIVEPWDPSHGEGWRWGIQPALDVARAILARDYLVGEDYAALRRPWDWFVGGGASEEASPAPPKLAAAAPTKRSARAADLPWLEERVGVYETFKRGMILARPTYSVAYVVNS